MRAHHARILAREEHGQQLRKAARQTLASATRSA
jgi:hypothetical protein